MFSYVLLALLTISLSSAALINLENLNPGKIPTSGAAMAGQSVAGSKSMSLPLNVWVGDVDITTTAVITSTTFQINVPPGSGASSQAIFCFNNCVDYAQFTVVYEAPIITSVSQLPADGGSVTITGQNLGTLPAKITVIFISERNYVSYCTSISVVISHTKITCTVPMGTNTYGTAIVNVDGQNSTAFSTTLNDYCLFTPSASNVIANSRFETGTTASWSTGAGTGSFTIVSTASSLGCGSYSAKLISMEMKQNFPSKQNVNAQWIFSALVYDETSTPGTISASFQTNPNQVAFTTSEGSPAYGGWKYIRTIFPENTGATPTIELKLGGLNVTQHYDNIRMCAIGDPGCVWEIIYQGNALWPHTITVNSATPVYGAIYNGKRCLKHTGSPGALGSSLSVSHSISVNGNSRVPTTTYTPSFTTLTVEAACACSFEISVVAGSTIAVAANTNWANYTIALTVGYTGVSLKPASGCTVYVASAIIS